MFNEYNVAKREIERRLIAFDKVFDLGYISTLAVTKFGMSEKKARLLEDTIKEECGYFPDFSLPGDRRSDEI